MNNWQWRHAGKDEIDNMTYDEARGIIQPYIDRGIQAMKLGYLSGTDFPPRPSWYATRALQILVDRADKAQKYEKFLREIINETHKDHYGDSALAYSIICDMLSEVEKQMRE